MSNKQNLASEILAAWQKHTQDYLNDPKSAQTIIEHYAKFQETLDNFTNQASNATHTSHDKDANDQLSKFAQRIDELEIRIKILERALATNFERSS